MLRLHKYILLTSAPDNFANWPKSKEKEGAFYLINKNNHTFIIPEKINCETINPKNIIQLKKKLKFAEILIADKVKGVNKLISIGDHVNRSGQNFLRSATPEGDLPQFPDMSKIYKKNDRIKSVIVHTLGKDRFKTPPIEKDIIWSEYAGLVAPVFHYVGISVYALGVNKLDQILDLI